MNHLTPAVNAFSSLSLSRHAAPCRGPKLARFPGVAQLAAHLIWDQEVAGSSPVTRTNFSQAGKPRACARVGKRGYRETSKPIQRSLTRAAVTPATESTFRRLSRRDTCAGHVATISRAGTF